MSRPRSPLITGVSWGRLEVEGHPPLKDAMLYPGGCRAWDWNESGTSHDPGIRPAAVQELLDRGAQVIVLSRGMVGRLRVHLDTANLLAGRGIPVHVLETAEAVRIYNELASTLPVGGLFHSTC